MQILQTIVLLVVGASFVIAQCVIPGNYTFNSLQLCNNTNLWSVPNGFVSLTINGMSIASLAPIKDYNYVGLKSLVITNTSLTNLTNLPSTFQSNNTQAQMVFVESNKIMVNADMKMALLPINGLSLRHLPLLKEVESIYWNVKYNWLPSGVANSFLEVTDCDLIPSVIGPPYGWRAGFRISNNNNLMTVTGFDAPFGTSFTLPALFANYALFEISGNPKLTTISIYPTATTTSSIIIQNNSALTTANGIGFTTITSYAIISDNGALTDLGTKFTSVAALYVERNPILTGWSALYRLTSMPLLFSANGSACPSYTFFNTPTFFTRDSFQGCVDLLQIVSVSIQSGPVTGGMQTLITVAGTLAEPTFNASFGGPNSVPCQPTASANVFVCIVPPNPIPAIALVSIRVSASRPWITSAFQFQYLSVSDYFGADLTAENASTTAYTAPALDRVSTASLGAPGVPETHTAEVASRTTALTVTVGVILFCFIILVVVGSIFCGHRQNWGEALAWLPFLDGLKYMREDQSEKPTEDGYTVRRQGSRISGTITIVTAAVALTGISALAIQFSRDNVAVNNSLQPVDDSPTAFASSYSATIISSGSTVCSANPNTTLCALNVKVNGFAINSPTPNDGITCTSVETSVGTSVGTSVARGCRVDYRCGACTLTLTSPTMTISDGSVNAYVLSYAFSATSVDYFGHESVATGSVSAQAGSVLKGSSSPATASVTFTPASFSNYGTVTTGVLTRVVGTSPGNQMTLDQFGAASGTAFTLQFTANQNARSIEISEKQSSISAIAQAAGFVSGAATVGHCLVILIFVTIKQLYSTTTTKPETELSPV